MRPLVYEMDLPLPRDRVFRAWVTDQGLASWMCARASVDPVVGGRVALWGDLMGDDEASQPSIVFRVLSIDHPRLLALGCEDAHGITAGVRPEEVESSRVEVLLFPTLDGTRLRVTHSGFRETDGSMWVRRRFEGFWWSALEGIRVALGT